jgi:hypothetical protein
VQYPPTLAELVEELEPWLAPEEFPYEVDYIIQRKEAASTQIGQKFTGGRVEGTALVWGYARGAVVCGKRFAVTLDEKEYVSGTTKDELDKELDETLLHRIQDEVVEQLPSAAR